MEFNFRWGKCWKRSLKKIMTLSIKKISSPILSVLQFKLLQSTSSLREFIPSPDYSTLLQLVATIIPFILLLVCIYNPGAISFRSYSQVWGRGKRDCKIVQWHFLYFFNQQGDQIQVKVSLFFFY